MKLTDRFWKDLRKLIHEDKRFAAKVFELIREAETNRSTPTEGKGSPEKLKGDLSGAYSRRINKKHRLIYHFDDKGKLVVTSCYLHYEDR